MHTPPDSLASANGGIQPALLDVRVAVLEAHMGDVRASLGTLSRKIDALAAKVAVGSGVGIVVALVAVAALQKAGVL